MHTGRHMSFESAFCAFCANPQKWGKWNMWVSFLVSWEWAILFVVIIAPKWRACDCWRMTVWSGAPEGACAQFYNRNLFFSYLWSISGHKIVRLQGTVPHHTHHQSAPTLPPPDITTRVLPQPERQLICFFSLFVLSASSCVSALWSTHRSETFWQLSFFSLLVLLSIISSILSQRTQYLSSFFIRLVIHEIYIPAPIASHLMGI